MSLSNKVKEAFANLEALTKERDTLVATVADKDQSIKQLTEALDKACAESKTVKESLETSAKTHADEVAALKAELDGVSKTLTEAQARLANPAYADAASKGTEPVADGKVAAEPAPDLYAQYRAIADPMARAAFWKKNEKAILAGGK